MCEGEVKAIALCKRQQSVTSLKHSSGLLCMGQLDRPSTSPIGGRNPHQVQYQSLVASPTFDSHYLTKSLQEGQQSPSQKESRLFDPVSKSNKGIFLKQNRRRPYDKEG